MSRGFVDRKAQREQFPFGRHIGTMSLHDAPHFRENATYSKFMSKHTILAGGRREKDRCRPAGD